MRHRLIFGVGIALAAVLLSSDFLYNYSQDRARIIRFQGVVSVERAGKKVPTVAGALLNAGDKIVTGPNAFAEVAYDDAYRDILRIGSKTNVILRSAIIEKQTTVYMDKGALILKLQDLKKGSAFKVETPVAVAGVRGTSFGVTITGDRAVIADYESKIYVKGLDQDFMEMKDEILLNAGWKTHVTRFETPSEVERITPQEYEDWKTWLDEIAALSKKSIARNSVSEKFTFLQDTFFRIHAPCLTPAFARNATSSAPFLVFLLYVALTANLGKMILNRL